jgi:hypothetical protein
MAKVKETIIRRNNPNNITYVLKKYTNNTYELTTLVYRAGCYVVAGRQTGICKK